MESTEFARQSELFNPDLASNQPPIVVVGAGTIGSWFTVFALKMGLKNITVFDPDTLELHNSASSVYPRLSMGVVGKVAILQEVSFILTDNRIRPVEAEFDGLQSMFTKESMPKEDEIILVSAVDSMQSRRQIFNYIVETGPTKVRCLVDGRIADNLAAVYCIRNSVSELQEYEHTLANDDSSWIKNETVRKISDAKCAGSIIDTAVICAGMMVNSVRCLLTHRAVIRARVIDVCTFAGF